MRGSCGARAAVCRRLAARALPRRGGTARAARALRRLSAARAFRRAARRVRLRGPRRSRLGAHTLSAARGAAAGACRGRGRGRRGDRLAEREIRDRGWRAQRAARGHREKRLAMGPGSDAGPLWRGLMKNLLAGARLALFLPVRPLDFRISAAQCVALVAACLALWLALVLSPPLA